MTTSFESWYFFQRDGIYLNEKDKVELEKLVEGACSTALAQKSKSETVNQSMGW